MRTKNINLEWNVLYWDNNIKKTRKYNIFRYDFIEILHKKVLKKQITNREELKEFCKKEFMYHYWSKCECELIVGYHFSKYPDEFEKIDMYKQIEINLDLIVDYIIHKTKLEF